MYVVVMAGGGGTRLHPLSTPERPKPFLPLLGHETLLQRTVRRLLAGPELGIAAADVTVVTAEAHRSLVEAQLPEVAILAEPVGRNTAPAIALAALGIERDDDDIMLVLPADHTIEREAAFRSVLRAAADHLAIGAFGIDAPLVTLGIRPAHPATGCGYLRPRLEAGADVAGRRAYPLAAFVEKPTAGRATGLLAEPGIAWNAGIFLWRRRAILTALEADAADISGMVAAGLRGGRLDAAYGEVRATSIDYAIMEPAAEAGRVVMATADVGWSDLGGWTALLAALGSRASGSVVQAGQAAAGETVEIGVP